MTVGTQVEMVMVERTGLLVAYPRAELVVGTTAGAEDGAYEEAGAVYEYTAEVLAYTGMELEEAVMTG